MLLTIRTIPRPLIRATALLAGIAILAWGGYSILGAYEGFVTVRFASLLAIWSGGLLAAATGVMLLTLMAPKASRAGRSDEISWTDIPDDLPMVAQFDAALRASGQSAEPAEDAPWAGIPDDLPAVAQFDAYLRTYGRDADSADDAPWAGIPDDLPAVAQFDAYLRTYGRNADPAGDAPWTDIPDDLPAMAQFDASSGTRNPDAVHGRGWKQALLRWIQEVPDAALARREYLRNTQSQEYLRFYGCHGQFATDGAGAMPADERGPQRMDDGLALGQRAITRHISARRLTDSQRIQ